MDGWWWTSAPPSVRRWRPSLNTTPGPRCPGAAWPVTTRRSPPSLKPGSAHAQPHLVLGDRQLRAHLSQYPGEEIVAGEVGQTQRELARDGEDQVAGGGRVHGGDLEHPDRRGVRPADGRADDLTGPP